MEPTPSHAPALLTEVIESLAVRPGEVVVDATVGLGGHAAALQEGVGPTGLLIGLDVDPANLQTVAGRLSAEVPYRLVQANFAQLSNVLEEMGISQIDVLLADLGVNSYQLNNPERGFSFQQNGPLDMRLDPRLPTTAADLINALPESELADLIYEYGEERFSRRIARAIHQARHEHRLQTTGELARLICRAVHQDPDHPRTRIHPATRTFMALRIAVNGELEALSQLLEQLPRILRPGGRAAMISFHSLEDRLCKQAFRRMVQAGLGELMNKKPITSTAEETRRNPRARSAKLRVIRRIDDLMDQ